LLFLIAAVWTTISRNPYAQGLRGIFGRTPDQVILDRAFSVSAHGFRFYKFSLPEGPSNMAVAGQFRVASDAAENTIEVLVLSEEELAKWQAGSVAHSICETGRSSEASVQCDLPSGAGSYFIVFSNKLSTVAPKKITARLVLRHKNWWR
jgi:hypothetical protein